MKLESSAVTASRQVWRGFRSPLAKWGLAACWGLGLPAGTPGAILINGGFDNSNSTFAANQGTGVMQLAGGYADAGILPGWNVIGGLSSLGHPDGIAWESNDNQTGLRASVGDYFLNLAGYAGTSHRGGVSLSQPIATVVGQSYRLTFDLGSCSTAAGDVVNPLIKVTLTGSPGTYFSGDNSVGPATGIVSVWTTETLTFTANSTATFIGFNNCTSLRNNDFFVGLDNVAVTAVPEPATCLAGLFGLGLALRFLYPKRAQPVE